MTGVQTCALPISAELRAKGYRKATDVLGLSPYDKRKERAKEREAKGKKARKAAPTPKETKTAVYQRPGMIKRNINTLMGREPGYVDDRTPEEKLKQKGGRVGKFARGVGDTLRSTVGSGLD